MSATIEAAIPADWDVTDNATWRLASDAEANLGVHAATGYTVRDITDVIHAARDLGADKGETGEDAAAWWAAVLVPIHEWAVARLEATTADLDVAYAATGIRPDEPDTADDLEAQAADCRRLLAALGAP